ncbi:MAG: D-alanyl-D-alanine carboxypeptidase [Parcubacteria group bacterium]|nr:D-alanyl-D-alanine carboxypeptidase [Parcubacteria group bacterium]
METEELVQETYVEEQIVHKGEEEDRGVTSDMGHRAYFSSWGLFALTFGALGIGWFSYSTMLSTRIKVVEQKSVSPVNSKDIISGRYRTMGDLEQPHLSVSHQPLTALISNFDVPDIEVGAYAVLITDLTTQVDLFAKNQDLVWPIASVTKLLTAAAAEEISTPKQPIIISKEAVGIEGSSGNLVVGEKFYLDNLVQLMLLVSSNDAAKAIEEELGSKLLVRMRSIITGLGLSRSHIEEVTGLSPQNVSTPRELKSIVQYIYRVHPELFHMTKAREVVISSASKKHKLVNIDYLALHPELGFLGGKTGTIDESGQNIVALFEHNNHTISIILLGSTDRFKDVEALLQWTKRAYVFK